jgi:hypothetical protein
MTILAAMDNAIRDIDSGRLEDDPETEAEQGSPMRREAGDDTQR